jgi:hypothetical protein
MHRVVKSGRAGSDSWAPPPGGPRAMEGFPGLSVAVAVVVLPMRIPFPASVLVMTPVSIGVANPTAWMTINSPLTMFRLAPTIVAIMVASDTDTMVAVRVTALVGMAKRYCRESGQCYEPSRRNIWML